MTFLQFFVIYKCLLAPVQYPQGWWYFNLMPYFLIQRVSATLLNISQCVSVHLLPNQVTLILSTLWIVVTVWPSYLIWFVLFFLITDKKGNQKENSLQIYIHFQLENGKRFLSSFRHMESWRRNWRLKSKMHSMEIAMGYLDKAVIKLHSFED